MSFDREEVTHLLNPVIPKLLKSTFHTGHLPKCGAHGIAFPCRAQGRYPANVRLRRRAQILNFYIDGEQVIRMSAGSRHC